MEEEEVMSEKKSVKKNLVTAGSAGTIGGGVGYVVAEVTGATAVGVLGTGVGAAALPVAIGLGAVLGLAAYGISRIWN
jgi:hypothetical protein